MKIRKRQRQLPMTKRIIYIPLVAIAIGFLLIGYYASYAARMSLLAQMNLQASNLSDQMAARINDHRHAMKTIEGQLEEKIKIIGASISAEQVKFTGHNLRKFAEVFGIGEINWFSKEGVILASSIAKYEGWIAPPGHPVQTFISKDYKLWSEPIRKDSESNRYNKYGYYRLNDGKFLQIALPADDVHKLTNRFTEDYLMRILSKYNGIVQAAYLNNDFQRVAFSKGPSYLSQVDIQRLLPGTILDKASIDLLRLGQKVSGESLKGKVYEVYVPIMDEGIISGYLNIAFDMVPVMQMVYETSLRVLIVGLVTLLAIALTMEWLLKRYVARPIEDLAIDMEQIHVETNMVYRLPSRASDPFTGLRRIMNQVLGITNQYFEEIIAHQEELIAANEELEATIGQLCASEEELRAQYDEIEAYAHHMAQLKQRFSIAIEATGCYIWELDCTTETLVISDHLVTYLGLTTDEIQLEKFVQNYVHPDDAEVLKTCLTQMTTPVMAGMEAVHIQVRLAAPGNGARWHLMRGSITGDAPIEKPQLAGVIVDIHQQKEQEQYIQYLADHDPLTGLFSRRKFQEVVSKAITRGKSGTVLLMDIDNFKNINDYYGHVYGDKVLKHFANLLKAHLCDKSQVYRLGGDEFIIHTDGSKSLEEVIDCLKELVIWIQEHQIIDGLEQRLTISTGIAQYPLDAIVVDELMMKADLAMYESKKSGKNRYSCYNDALKEVLSHRLMVENHLRLALANDGFVMHYQPVVDTNTLEVGYFEALIRLKDNAYSPADLIAISEESGLIHSIGRWVIKAVIEQQASWRDKGYALKPIAINLSPRQMLDVQLVPFIAQLLDQYNLDPKHFEMEITENILVENREENLAVLEAIRKLGLSIALDDFGTGYSSLNYLTFIPVDKIKLDKSLKDKFIDLESIQVMDSLISLAHGLQLKVVAEGVETALESRRLIYGKCDYLQGYYFSRPLTVTQIEDWFANPSMSPILQVESNTSVQIV